MILTIILTSIFQIQGKYCSLTPITCQSIMDIGLCQTAKDYNYNNVCEWDDECVKVTSAKLPCDQFLNEYTCKHKAYKCNWEGTQTGFFSEISQKENTDGKCVIFTCSSYSHRFSCQSFADVSCDWQDGQCIEITKCEDFKTILGCIKSRLKQKCAAIVDGNVIDPKKRTLPDQQNLQCVIEECKHKIRMSDCTFVNGVQCFWRNKKCSKCLDYDTYDSCVQNLGQCYWNMNQCQNIECQILNNPTMCNLKQGQCIWNKQKYKCQLNQDKADQHCYQEYLSTQNNSFQMEIIISIILILIQ